MNETEQERELREFEQRPGIPGPPVPPPTLKAIIKAQLDSVESSIRATDSLLKQLDPQRMAVADAAAEVEMKFSLGGEDTEQYKSWRASFAHVQVARDDYRKKVAALNRKEKELRKALRQKPPNTAKILRLKGERDTLLKAAEASRKEFQKWAFNADLQKYDGLVECNQDRAETCVSKDHDECAWIGCDKDDCFCVLYNEYKHSEWEPELQDALRGKQARKEEAKKRKEKEEAERKEREKKADKAAAEEAADIDRGNKIDAAAGDWFRDGPGTNIDLEDRATGDALLEWHAQYKKWKADDKAEDKEAADEIAKSIQTRTNSVQKPKPRQKPDADKNTARPDYAQQVSGGSLPPKKTPRDVVQPAGSHTIARPDPKKFGGSPDAPAPEGLPPPGCETCAKALAKLKNEGAASHAERKKFEEQVECLWAALKNTKLVLGDLTLGLDRHAADQHKLAETMWLRCMDFAKRHEPRTKAPPPSEQEKKKETVEQPEEAPADARPERERTGRKTKAPDCPDRNKFAIIIYDGEGSAAEKKVFRDVLKITRRALAKRYGSNVLNRPYSRDSTAGAAERDRPKLRATTPAGARKLARSDSMIDLAKKRKKAIVEAFKRGKITRCLDMVVIIGHGNPGPGEGKGYYTDVYGGWITPDLLKDTDHSLSGIYLIGCDCANSRKEWIKMARVGSDPDAFVAASGNVWEYDIGGAFTTSMNELAHESAAAIARRPPLRRE